MLDVKAPKPPKKFVIFPNDCIFPKPGSSGLCEPRLIRTNRPEAINIKPTKVLNRNNLNPPYLNILIVSNTFRIR